MEKKQQHTPEPWEVKFNSYEDSEGIIQHNTGPNWSLWIVEKMAESESDIANARRIVSCVNALAGIENPEKFVAKAKANEQRIASLTEQVEQRWISVDERLPEDQERVLILEQDGYIGMSRYGKYYSDSKKMEFHVEQDEQPGTYIPTHWQPLPKVPNSYK